MISSSEIVELKVIDRIESVASSIAACHKYCDAMTGATVGLDASGKLQPPTPGFIDRIEQRLVDLEKEAAELSERLDRIARRLA